MCHISVVLQNLVKVVSLDFLPFDYLFHNVILHVYTRIPIFGLR